MTSLYYHSKMLYFLSVIYNSNCLLSNNLKAELEEKVVLRLMKELGHGLGGAVCDRYQRGEIEVNILAKYLGNMHALQ